MSLISDALNKADRWSTKLKRAARAKSEQLRQKAAQEREEAFQRWNRNTTPSPRYAD